MPTSEEMREKIHRALEDPTLHAVRKGALKKRLAEIEAQIEAEKEPLPPPEPIVREEPKAKKKAPKAKKA